MLLCHLTKGENDPIELRLIVYWAWKDADRVKRDAAERGAIGDEQKDCRRMYKRSVHDAPGH